MQRSLECTFELIDRQQLKELEPDWTVDEVELAAYEPDSGYGDGAGVANDFLSRARDLGVTYLPQTRSHYPCASRVGKFAAWLPIREKSPLRW